MSPPGATSPTRRRRAPSTWSNGTAAAVRNVQAGTGPRIRVLMVEDDHEDATQIRDLLGRTWDLDIVIVGTAVDAERALAQSAAAPFDLVVLDVGLPDVDGIELCRRLRARAALSLLPIMMISCHTSAQYVAAALDAGATDYVCKPVRIRELVARIRVALRDKQQRERASEATIELQAVTADLKEINAALERLTALDPLTQLPNRRQFNLVYLREWRLAARTGASLAVVMIDIDHFHGFNERYGHLAGDACLVAVAGALVTAAQRPTDFPARWGGEELVYVLPDTDLDGARLVAERVRSAIEALQLAHDGSAVSPFVTVSVGLAATVPSLLTAPEVLLGAADAAMFRAKALGRNRVCGPADLSAAR